EGHFGIEREGNAHRIGEYGPSNPGQRCERRGPSGAWLRETRSRLRPCGCGRGDRWRGARRRRSQEPSLPGSRLDPRKLLRDLLGKLAVRILRGKRSPKPNRCRALALVAEPVERIERQPSGKPQRIIAVLAPRILANDRLVV